MIRCPPPVAEGRHISGLAWFGSERPPSGGLSYGQGAAAPCFLLVDRRQACAGRRWPAMISHGGKNGRASRQMEAAVVSGSLQRRYRRWRPLFRKRERDAALSAGWLAPSPKYQGRVRRGPPTAGQGPPVSGRRPRPAGCGAVPLPARQHANSLPARRVAARCGRASRAPRAGSRAGDAAAGP